MDALRIRNLRSLEDTKKIAISPITLLIGENSSGKSTFLRFFPLLKQSAETEKSAPILWYGKYVDFGDFSTAITSDVEKHEIIFDFYMTPKKSNNFFIRRISKDITGVEVAATIKLVKKDGGGTRLAEARIIVNGHKIKICLGVAGDVCKAEVDGIDLTTWCSDLRSYDDSRLFPFMVDAASNGDFDSSFWYNPFRCERIKQQIISIISHFDHGNTQRRRQISLAASIGLPKADDDFVEKFLRSSNATMTLRGNLSAYRGSASVAQLRALIILNHSFNIFLFLEEYFKGQAENVNYIAPVRASAERYYRHQELSVRDVDPRGGNIFIFIRSLSAQKKSGLDSWLMEKFGFAIEVQSEGGHLSLGLKYLDDDHYYNLADMGFGYSQVLPILIQLWVLQENNGGGLSPYIFAIEQPELHLHPRMQAKIADILVQAVEVSERRGIDIRIIVETHSETIINRIGWLVSLKKIRSKNVNLLLFSKGAGAFVSDIRVAEYDEDGVLRNWPFGFFEPQY